MDEEDGRLGPRALQSEAEGVLKDAAAGCVRLGCRSTALREGHPSGAKARLVLCLFLARLKPCPFKTVRWKELCRQVAAGPNSLLRKALRRSWHNSRKATAGPSTYHPTDVDLSVGTPTPFAAKNAANSAQDDSSVYAAHFRDGTSGCAASCEGRPSGAKAPTSFIAFIGTTEVVPFQSSALRMRFSASDKVVRFQNSAFQMHFSANDKVVPAQNCAVCRLFSRAVKCRPDARQTVHSGSNLPTRCGAVSAVLRPSSVRRRSPHSAPAAGKHQSTTQGESR
jgi:hypothetical protein